MGIAKRVYDGFVATIGPDERYTRLMGEWIAEHGPTP